MPTIRRSEVCPHCERSSLADFLGPTALAVLARGICPHCLKWKKSGLPAYDQGRTPETAEDASGGELEINRLEAVGV